MGINIEVTKRLSKVLTNNEYMSKRLDDFIKAGANIVEAEYVQEAPTLEGDFRRGIQVKKGNEELTWIVTSTSKSKRDGFDYPLALYTGTGRLRGTADTGYTQGRVRTGTVARGIGGIRPNKVADRAKKKAEAPTVKFVNNKIRELLNG